MCADTVHTAINVREIDEGQWWNGARSGAPMEHRNGCGLRTTMHMRPRCRCFAAYTAHMTYAVIKRLRMVSVAGKVPKIQRRCRVYAIEREALDNDNSHRSHSIADTAILA